MYCRDETQRWRDIGLFINGLPVFTKENTRIEHDKALQRVMMAIMREDTELFKQFSDNDGFKRWLGVTVFELAWRA